MVLSKDSTNFISSISYLEILSLSSKIILSAVFNPIPLTDLILFTSDSRIAFFNSPADKDDNIIIAVLGPTPDIDTKSKNVFLSFVL